MNTITTYLRESLEELRHVRWPTRQQAIRLTVVVIVFTALSSIFFGLLDIGLSEVVKFLVSLAV